MNKEEVVECEEDIQLPASPFGPPAPILQIKNNLYVYGEIDDTLAKSFIAALHENAMENISVSFEHDVAIPPINIIINSPGGQISSALGIVAAIEDIQTGRIPNTIPYAEELVVDGEIICTYSDFNSFSSDYKNPRNFAAGSVRLLDKKEFRHFLLMK